MVQGAKVEDTFWWKKTATDNANLYDAWVLYSVEKDRIKNAISSAARLTLAKDQAALNKVLTDIETNSTNKETETN